MKIMLAIVIGTILTWALSAGAIVDPVPEDKSDPELVREYIGMPCEGLDKLYAYLYSELIHLTNHYKACIDRAENGDDPFLHLVCYYEKLEWELIYSHAVSVEKAYNLMCNDWGERKEREYEIDF